MKEPEIIHDSVRSASLRLAKRIDDARGAIGDRSSGASESLPPVKDRRYPRTSLRSAAAFAALLFAAFFAVARVAAAAPTALPPPADAEVRAVVKDAKGEAVPDAVISLHPLDGAPLPPPSTEPVEIVQKDQEYMPYVTAVRVGTQAVFPNHDTVQHHIYSLSKAKRFEKPLYAPGSREAVLFDQPGVVTLGCNIHDWMLAYVVVLPTPYFAKTDASGTARIAVPAGSYRIEVWHPRLAAPDVREAKLGPGVAPLDYALKLKPDRRIRRSPEGKASGY
ncbi:MAG: methylamine utilization protein [Opitutae bacterium]|nr:methylamine utilization protein [Opitutae bacterium]